MDQFNFFWRPGKRVQSSSACFRVAMLYRNKSTYLSLVANDGT